jgi:multisubunit Na+/H+ antiporter MnhF subunit
VNAWLSATAVLATAGLPPCVWRVCHGGPHERLAALNLATTFLAVLLALVSEGFGRSSYIDMALVLAVLGPAGTLVFARFLGAQSTESGPSGQSSEVS